MTRRPTPPRSRRKLLPLDAARYLTDDDAVAEYMTAVLESGDSDLLLRALGDIARVRGMAKVARDTGLGREAAVRHHPQGGEGARAQALRAGGVGGPGRGRWFRGADQRPDGTQGIRGLLRAWRSQHRGFMNAREWSARIAELALREHSALADLLLAIAEFDELAVYRQLGFSSLFDFLHREIGLSRGSAYYRQVGARMIRRFPEVEEPIRDGRLCVTTVGELAKVMTEENRAEVLPRFFGCSREEARQLVAEMLPAEVVPRRTVVTEVPLLAPVEAEPLEPSHEGVLLVGRDRTHPCRGVPAAVETRTVVEPLTSTESRMHVTVSPAFMTLLKKARAGQSHVQPGASDEQVLTAALELLLEKQEKRKASVPAKVKREVVKWDEGKCKWPLDGGGVCGSEVRLEIDHVVPRGRGGPSTVSNCRVLCRAHNLEAARQVYGDEYMDLFTAQTPRDGGRDRV
jgi:probable addiction module antidote protein